MNFRALAYGEIASVGDSLPRKLLLRNQLAEQYLQTLKQNSEYYSARPTQEAVADSW